MPRGRPREGEQRTVRLSDEDESFARSLSPMNELSDGIRQALDAVRIARGMAVPKRATRRRSGVKKLPQK